jgi:hypothetical protein
MACKAVRDAQRMDDAVDRLLAAIESGTLPPSGIFADDVSFDATVPNWRFTLRGAEIVRDQLGSWYRDPGQFEELRRTPLPDGELVEFTLAWEEGGVPHAGHQAHILRLVDGVIASDTVFCGGRWPAALLAEMAEAERARA